MAALPENDRISGPFIAVTGQTDFPADFPLIDADAVRARLERGSTVMELTPPSVGVVDLGSSGFTARLQSAALAGDRVWIYSDLATARLRNHTPNGAVRTETLEADAMSFQAQLQETRRDLSRAVLTPPGVTPPTMGDIRKAADAGANIEQALTASQAALEGVEGKVDRDAIATMTEMAFGGRELIDVVDTQALFDRAYADAMARWWQAGSGRIWGRDGGFGASDERPYHWTMCNLHEAIYWRAKAGDATAAARVASNYAELVGRVGVETLSSASIPNDVGASDDLSWMVRYFAHVHDITGSAQALTICRNLLVDGLSVFADPGGFNIGMLYTTDYNATDPSGPQLGHRRVVASNDIFAAIAALYLESKGAANPPGQTWRDYAIHTHAAIKAHFIGPLGVVYTEVDVDPAHAGVPKAIDFSPPGQPIKPHYSSCAIHMTFAFMALCAQLHQVTGAPSYVADINAMMASVLRYDTYLRPGHVLCPDRDGWGNGLGFPEFIASVVETLPGINAPTLIAVRQAVMNTAVSACRMRTPPYYYSRGRAWGEGFYGADWNGPEMGSNGMLSWSQTAVTDAGPPIGLPEQIETAGSTQSLIVAAKMLGGSSAAILPTWGEIRALLAQIIASFVPLLGAVKVREHLQIGKYLEVGTVLRVARDLGPDFFMDSTVRYSRIGLDAGDLFRYDKQDNRHEFLIGNTLLGYFQGDKGGALKDYEVGDVLRVARNLDHNFYLDASGSRRRVVFDDSDSFEFDRASNRFLFRVGGVTVAYVDTSGFHNGAG